MLPGFEEGVAGMQEGEITEIVLPPSDAFGNWEAKDVVEVDLKDLALPDRSGELLRTGSRLRLNTGRYGEEGSGEVREGRVTQVLEGVATIDLNHDLAGRSLHFKVRLLQVERACALMPFAARGTSKGFVCVRCLLPRTICRCSWKNW